MLLRLLCVFRLFINSLLILGLCFLPLLHFHASAALLTFPPSLPHPPPTPGFLALLNHFQGSLVSQQLQSMLQQPLLEVNADILEFVLLQALQMDGNITITDVAEKMLAAKRKLDKTLLSLLQKLDLSPLPLLDLGILNLSDIVDTSVDTLQAAFGPGAAQNVEALRQLAQRHIKFNASDFEVPSATLKVLKRIGRGSHAIVYEVTLNNKQLAFKQVNLGGVSETEHAELVASIRREFRVLQSLTHDNIVQQCGVVLDDPTSIGLLMELAPAGSLRALLDHDRSKVLYDELLQLQLATGIAEGMAFLHSNGPTLHHDLKSDNVLLYGPCCTPKITDFGLAVNPNISTTRHTMRAAAGTLAYKAPEQYDNEFGPKSEVYSYAIILWELLHGSRPWEGKNEAAVMKAVYVAQKRPDVSPESSNALLVHVMRECWAQNPDDRPSFADVKAPLLSALRTFGTSQFKKLYSILVTRTESIPLRQAELMESVRSLIGQFAQRHGHDLAAADEYFAKVQRLAFTAGGLDELIDADKLKCCAMRMYTTAEAFQGRELCSILNEALRMDEVIHAVTITRAINTFCVTRRAPEAAPILWPKDNTVFRGGGLPERHRHFFVQGKQYRVPMFLSTSDQIQVTKKFMERQQEDKVLWTIKLDPRGCKHVNFISIHDGSLGPNPNVAVENEFLFAPYSAFTVEAVEWQDAPTIQKPHTVVLRAEFDNQRAPENLPLAPWA